MSVSDRTAAGLVALGSPAARRPDVAGRKAARLAEALRAGLRVPDGLVIPTGRTRGGPGEVRGHLDGVCRDVWERLAPDGGRLVVRSSSPEEDTAGASLAGRFESVVGVEDPEALRDAVEVVVASRDDVGEAEGGPPAPRIAVLVQPEVTAEIGGVMFTVDPVTGDDRRVVVTASREGPDAVVSGRVPGSTYRLDAEGAVVGHDEGDERGDDPAALGDGLRRDLVALAARVEELFGAPQDVEWAAGPDGTLWLLQSRPVTGVRDVPLRPHGEVEQSRPILGPGPVAETFPEPLGPLEQELWVPPLEEALRHVFRLVGSTRLTHLEDSPVVRVIEGRVAVDLDLFGLAERDDAWWRRLDPRPRLRRLRISWRVGRMRASLPAQAGSAVGEVDEALSAVPALVGLTDRQLLGLLDRVGEVLVSVHAHEVLIGFLLSEERPGLSGPSVALRVLATARRDGHSDREILSRHPITLALVPPRISTTHELPALPSELPPRPVTGEDADETMVLREALRVRARWLQELQARAVIELAGRLRREGVLDDHEQVRALTLDELRAMVRERTVTWDLRPEERLPTGAPLPPAFRLAADGSIVPTSAGSERGGTGAGGGRGSGPARIAPDAGSLAAGDVAVVGTLDPALGGVVHRLGGLVAATGSVLSHVAILAREAGVPTVVGVSEATSRFRGGQRLVVDGDEGTVDIEEDA